MNRQAVGILGCVLLAAASMLAVEIVFLEEAIIAAGFPYNFFHYSVLAAALFGGALGCGLGARRAPAGKIALIGSLVLAALFAGFVVLVLVAFSIEG
jgi:hypothetical protein